MTRKVCPECDIIVKLSKGTLSSMCPDSNITPSSDHEVAETSTPNHELLLTRRHFLYGALGVGALALSMNASTTDRKAFAADADDLAILSVPEDAVSTLDDFTETPWNESVALIGDYELPYGTLLWTNNDTIAACLLPTETSKPLTQVGILALRSGICTTVLEAAVGQEQGFEIYDVRANESGLIWTEANVFSGEWQVYTATLKGESLGDPVKVAEGDSEWETPTLAAVGDHAFWQVLPVATGIHRAENSVLKRARFGEESSEDIYASEGRMSTPPYAMRDKLVITPRTSTDDIYHQLTVLEASSAETKDSLVLPSNMKPLEAGYGQTGFTFSFDGIYDYGEGISNLGTYTPIDKHDAYDYENKSWFRFNKAPTAPPSWCKDLFIVKSTRSVCGVNLDERTYFALDVESGSDTYGDYLASTGENESFTTFSNIHSKGLNSEDKKYCKVRVWANLS